MRTKTRPPANPERHRRLQVERIGTTQKTWAQLLGLVTNWYDTKEL